MFDIKLEISGDLSSMWEILFMEESSATAESFNRSEQMNEHQQFRDEKMSSF